MYRYKRDNTTVYLKSNILTYEYAISIVALSKGVLYCIEPVSLPLCHCSAGFSTVTGSGIWQRPPLLFLLAVLSACPAIDVFIMRNPKTNGCEALQRGAESLTSKKRKAFRIAKKKISCGGWRSLCLYLIHCTSCISTFICGRKLNLSLSSALAQKCFDRD